RVRRPGGAPARAWFGFTFVLKKYAMPWHPSAQEFVTEILRSVSDDRPCTKCRSPPGRLVLETAVFVATPIKGVARGPVPPEKARNRLAAQLLLAQQPHDLLLVKPTDPPP